MSDTLLVNYLIGAMFALGCFLGGMWVDNWMWGRWWKRMEQLYRSPDQP